MTPTIRTDAPPLRNDPDGTIRVGNSRIVIDVIVEAYRDGSSAEEIAEMYPVLRVEEVYGAITYYLRHRQELDEYIAEREQEAEEARLRIEASRPSLGSEVLRRHRRPS